MFVVVVLIVVLIPSRLHTFDTNLQIYRTLAPGGGRASISVSLVLVLGIGPVEAPPLLIS